MTKIHHVMFYLCFWCLQFACIFSKLLFIDYQLNIINKIKDINKNQKNRK